MPLRRTLLFLASFFAVFLWLALVPGGSRLMAADGIAKQEQRAAPGERLPIMLEALCVAVGESARERWALHLDGAQPADRRIPDDRRAGETGRSDSLERDANGNIVRTDRYMLAAYHAFALEDAAG